MNDQQSSHDLIILLKDLAIKLGRTPTSREFEAECASGRQVKNHFGSFNVMVQSAGLETNQAGPKKITNQVFEVSLEDHLSRYEPKVVQQPKVDSEKFARCLFIPDFHAPWGDLKIIEKACRFAADNNVEYIIQLGDLYDFIAHSKFPTSKNIYTPREEQKLARAQCEEMWKMLCSASRNAKKYQVWGNHDARPLKRILEAYPEAEDWVNKMITDLMTFDGVETIQDTRSELILPGNVMVLHGYLSRPGMHRDYNLGFNVVHGHLHTAHVVYRNIQSKVLFEMNCGIAADVFSKAFSYTPQKSLNWSRGFGWLDEYGPRFIPC